MSESIEIVNNRTVGTTHEGVGKRHSDFSSTERMANWSGNRKWVDGFQAISDESVSPTETTELWKTMGAASEEVFNELYTSVANLSDNISNLDLCTVSTLKDKAKEFGIDAGVMTIWENFPVEIAKMVDLFSINKAHLRGIVKEWSNGETMEYGLTTIASKDLWKKLAEECTDDDTYRRFIRNTFYNTLDSFVNMKPASGGNTPIWNLNGALNRRFSTNLFSSRIEYANPVEAAFGSGGSGGSSDEDKLIYERKQQLGVQRYFSEKYYADEILIGNRSLNEFSDPEQEIISMEIDRRKSLWLNSGVDQYTYVREAKVLHYVRFVTLFANAIYDVEDYYLDKRKSELLDLDETKYLIRTEGGTCSVDYSMIESVANTLTDYCINVSYFRETVRVQAQKNMLKGTKSLLVDSIREILAKNVYSTFGGCENFWRQTNVDGVVGTGIEMPKDLSIDIIEYIDNTRYTNIYAREDDDRDVVNSRFWQISGVQGDLTNEDVLDFYNRLTDYKDPWQIFQCANTTDDQKNPTYNLYQYLNYVFNSGAFSADLAHKVFDTELVASRLYPTMPEIYGYDEIVSLLRGSSTSAEVPNRLPKVFFDYDSAAVTLVDAFSEIDCGAPQYKQDESGEYTDEYIELYNRYHDFGTIRSLISSYKTPDEFIANASVIFPCAYFDSVKSRKYLFDRIVYEDMVTSSSETKIITDDDDRILSALCSTTRTIWTSEAQHTITTENGYTTIVTLSGSDVSTVPEKPYIVSGTESEADRIFDVHWNRVLASKYLQKPERMPEVFYYVSEYPSLYDEVFGDWGNYRHDESIQVIQNLGEGYNYDAYDAVYAESTYVDSMIHESGTFGEAMPNYIGDISYGNRSYANSQNTVHPSVQVHAFVTALIEYVNSYHAIVRYLDINQPKFETYCQTVVDRVDKIGNTIHYWKNSVDDFSGYTTDYEKNGNDADSNVAQDGPFNMDALQSLLDDKALFIDTIKRGTNEYYISKVDGTFILTDSEKRTEIDNITIYYDDICRLATKEISKFGRDKYGNTYVLYKDRGHRTDRDALGRLWIRKSDRPLAFPGIVVDELNGKLSNASQVSLTDNSEIEKKIIEQYKYPQRYYDDINTVGCYLTDVVKPGSGDAPINTRCYKVDWNLLKTEIERLPGAPSSASAIIEEIRGKNGYSPLSGFGLGPIVQSYFTFDDDGTFVPSGLASSIWDSSTPGYLTGKSDPITGYSDRVVIGDYRKGDIVLEMDNYEKVNYDADNDFYYHFKSGSQDVNEITFVVCEDSANVSGASNNFFLDKAIDGRDGTHHSITYHNLTISGIYTIRLKDKDSGAYIRGASIAMGSTKNTLTLDPIIDDGDATKTPRTMVGTMVIGGDDTNEIFVDFHGGEPTENTTGIVSIDGNGQNIGKYYDFTLNETLDVIVLDAKDPHYIGYDKSWALDAMINRPNNTDGSVEIQFFKDSQHNVEYVHMDDVTNADGTRRYVGVHCGNVNAGNRVHAIFAKIEENLVDLGDGTTAFVASKNMSFSCNTFGYDRYIENNFVPKVSYPAYKVNGKYHFRVNSDDSRVYIAFCSELPDHNDRVGNYVSGYDGMVAGSTTFNRCSSLGYLNGITVVGFDVTTNGLYDNGNIRYILKNETLGYYPQYSGLIGRNMTYANSSMVGRDVFGFELMFDQLSGADSSIEVKGPEIVGDNIVVNDVSRYDGGLFVEYTDNGKSTPKKKTMFLYGDDTKVEVDIKNSQFYAMGYDTHDDAGVLVKDSPFAIGFTSKFVAVSNTSAASDYDENRPSVYSEGHSERLSVILEDFDEDEDGNLADDSISYDISEVSNVDANGNFIVVCRGNHVLSCQYSEEDLSVYVKSVTHFVMEDDLDRVVNTFDGKFVAYPSKLSSGKINFVYALTNMSGYLSLGYYVTEYADTATIKDVDIFGGSVFVIFNGTNIDHVFRVDKCFDVGEKTVEEFIVLDESGDGYSTFTSDDDHLFLMPATLSGTVLIYNPQTDQFDDAYEFGRLISKHDKYSKILASRIANEKLRMFVHELEDDPETTEIDESMRYGEFFVGVGSDCNYAILELDKDFPILITYEVKDPSSYSDPLHPGITKDDNIELRFKCMFNTSEKGRGVHSLYSWERKTIDVAYAKATADGKEVDAKERYGDKTNEYIYGDSRVYRITATGQRKFKIERLYKTGFWPTGEFDADAYLSFTYDLAGYPNERRNKRFRHWNPDTSFQYTVSGPFSEMGLELGTQYVVGSSADEIEEKFKGMAISRDFDTYWLSGEMLHLVSVPEPGEDEYRHIDCLVDSNLAFAKNTIISSCESMFENHANLKCENRTLSFNYTDNSKHISNAERMFYRDENLLLDEVDITKCNVLNTMRMFEGCRVAPLVGAGFPESLTSVERMYADCRTAEFNWSMLMPGTVVSSLSSVFWNCQNGTFENFTFGPFPRFRKAGDPEFDDEIITVADIGYDIYGVSSITSKSDNERNLNNDWTEIIWTKREVLSSNPEAGKFSAGYVDGNPDSGRFIDVLKDGMSHVLKERFLSFSGVVGADEIALNFANVATSADLNPESGRYIDVVRDSMSSVMTERFFSFEGVTKENEIALNFANDVEMDKHLPEDEWWQERFLAFDWTENYEYDKPLLNLDGEVTVYESSTETHYDQWELPEDPTDPHSHRTYTHSGRFGEVIENSIIGDFMFWNTQKFSSNYIGFINVSHTLCSTISMFESCGKPYPEISTDESGRFVGEVTEQPLIYSERLLSFDMDATGGPLLNLDTSTDSDVPNGESGRYTGDGSEQPKIYQERLFSFDMDDIDGPLLNFSAASNDLYPGLDTFNDVIQMPNLVTGRRMFRGSAFNFKDSTFVTGRAIKSTREAFRRCEYIAERGPRLQTYSFRGVMEIDKDGKFNAVYIPTDMRAMYAECKNMPLVDVEILGNVVDVSPIGTNYPDVMFKCDFMFFGCSALADLVGKINPYATTARGMFAKCGSLTLDKAVAFLDTMVGRCDVTGMFYDCALIGSSETAKRTILDALGSNVVNGDMIFDKPDELDENDKLPWGIYDGGGDPE